MIKIVLIAAVLVMIGLVLLIATRPSDFRVSRSMTTSATPAKVFAEVNNFHRWQAWNPWEKLDPDMKSSFAGPEEGVGANYHWVGNGNVGEGTMTIVESRPGELVRIRLEFIKPMAGTNEATLSFTPEAGQTLVTWTMTGKNGFLAKAFGLVMNMDTMIGGNFEKGLGDLKAIVESAKAAN